MEKLGPLDKPRKESNTLVVLLHGAFRMPKSSANRLHDVSKVVDDALNFPDILAPQLPTHVSSFADPETLAWQVLRMIDQRVDYHATEGRPIQHIVFIGYSFGGLLARMVYVLACGETDSERWILRAEDGRPRPLFSKQKPPHLGNQKWAGNVRRLVLLAGMNRGWTIDFRVAGLWRTATFRVAEKLVSSLEKVLNLLRSMVGKPRCAAFGFTFRRGGRFIAGLRWQWLQMRQTYEKDKKLGWAPVIQLLGTKDDLVGPEDNIDLVTGKDFIYLEMPDCGHDTVVDMNIPQQKNLLADVTNVRTYCREMKPAFGRGAILDLSLAGLDENSEDFRKKMQDLSLQPEDDMLRSDTAAVTDIVFVIHGIRDLGYWTQKVAWRIREYGAKAGKHFKQVTRSYGYFPMGPFLFPAQRRKHVEWLVDQILEVEAQHPGKEMHYCGHSNGTYLLARALEDYPFLRFKHVVFAGSVVRDNYPWMDMIQRGQLTGGVLNYVATSDLVVGWFPKFFQATWPCRRWNDIGGGGFDGFGDLSTLQEPESLFTTNPALEVKYVHGAHGAAIGENSWGDIANAIVNGRVHLPAPSLYEKRQNPLIAFFSGAPILIWIVIILILYCLLCLTLGIRPHHFASGFQRWVGQLKAYENFPWIRLVVLWVEWRLLRFVLLRL